MEVEVNRDMHKALVAMGYRRTSKGRVWAKPLAWQFLTFEEDRKELTIWYVAADNTPGRWSVRDILVEDVDYESAVHEIKFGEEEVTGCWRGNTGGTHFEFLTNEESIGEYVGSLDLGN